MSLKVPSRRSLGYNSASSFHSPKHDETNLCVLAFIAYKQLESSTVSSDCLLFSFKKT